VSRCQVQLRIILERFIKVQIAPCTLELIQPTSRIVVNRRERAAKGPLQCDVKWLHALSERDSVGCRYTSQPRCCGELLSCCNLAICQRPCTQSWYSFQPKRHDQTVAELTVSVWQRSRHLLFLSYALIVRWKDIQPAALSSTLQTCLYQTESCDSLRLRLRKATVDQGGTSDTRSDGGVHV